jgi:NAD(P)-dependent dehydrogenase (short-subunit alcohol dehydrogenase family)
MTQAREEKKLMTTRTETRGVAIVTGAAGGMGSASAARLAAQGWALILCDINADRLESIAAPLRKSAQSIENLAGNIADPSFPAALLALLGARSIGALIHTAGLSPTMGDAAQIFAVNYDGTSRLVEAVRSRMLAGACAVLIASSSGYAAASPENDAALDAIPLDGDSSSLLKIASNPGHAYSLSKRGVQRLVERQAMAFGERRARIMSISPGLIDTLMGRAEAKAHPIMEEMRNKTPLARYGTADEIASVAVFLCSPDASFVTGSDIKVDGGVLAVMR